MQRTAVNPWNWSQALGYNQGEIIQDVKRQLICSGQTSVDDKGNPQHLEDMRMQMDLALNNLDAVLKNAEMSLTNISKLSIFTTDVDETMKNFDILGAKFGQVGASPTMTLVEVTRLAVPGLMFEVEAIAFD